MNMQKPVWYNKISEMGISFFATNFEFGGIESSMKNGKNFPKERF
jgi:hypothetical protein